MGVLSEIIFYRKEKIPKQVKEDEYSRIALFNGVGALFLAPLFALILYLNGAPHFHIFTALSYSLAFPFYSILCKSITRLRSALFYFLIFHLLVLTVLVFFYLISHGIEYNSFFFFLTFYILSIIIIQRLYASLIYHTLVIILFFYAHWLAVESVYPIQKLILLFTIFAFGNILMIYARTRITYSMEDYASYLKQIINYPGTGYLLIDFNEPLNIIDYNEEAKSYFIQNSDQDQILEKIFFSSFTDKETRQIRNLKLGNKFIKTLSIDKFNRAIELEIKITLLTLKNTIYWLAQLQDVTLQNKKHFDLEQSERKYRNLYHKNKAGVFTLNEDSIILDGNEAFFNLFDHSVKIGVSLFQGVNENDWDIIKQSLEEDGYSQNYQTQYQLRNGQVKTLIFSWYRDRQSMSIEGSVIDLTHIQKAAQALKQSEEKYRMIFEESNDAILLLKNDHIIDHNQAANKLLGGQVGVLKKSKLFDLSSDTSIENENRYTREKSKLLKKKNVKFNWLLRGEASDIEVELILTEIILENELFYQCVVHDLTEQNKLARERLRAEMAEELNTKLEAEIHERIRTEKLLQEVLLRTQAILESSSNTFLITLNKSKQITSFNSHCGTYFRQLFGHELMTNMGLNEFIKPMLDSTQKRYLDKLVDQILKGRSHQMEVKLNTLSGNSHWIEIYMSPIYDTEGKIQEVSLVAHDITEKKNNSIEIEDSLKQKEVLLKEIHHRVKNNLQVISSILNLQSSFVHDEKILDILQESRNRIRSMAIIHENLYKTKDFSSINFGEYLSNLVSNLVASYNVNSCVEILSDVDDVKLVLDQAIPCGLIVNEIITNALKYAWKDSFTEVRNLKIELKQKGKLVLISLWDNGQGLPKEFNKMSGDTLGLQLIVTLSEQLDATLEVDCTKGTKYLLTFENIKPQDYV